jgi:hypothetical protein
MSLQDPPGFLVLFLFRSHQDLNHTHQGDSLPPPSSSLSRSLGYLPTVGVTPFLFLGFWPLKLTVALVSQVLCLQKKKGTFATNSRNGVNASFAFQKSPSWLGTYSHQEPPGHEYHHQPPPTSDPYPTVGPHGLDPSGPPPTSGSATATATWHCLGHHRNPEAAIYLPHHSQMSTQPC